VQHQVATRQRASLSTAPAHRTTWTQVAAWRAARHHLDARVPRRRMLSLVSELCGLHAQVMSSAELTLWARVDGVSRDSLARALWRDRSLVKIWAMRGTLHVFRSNEHAAWCAALRTYELRVRRSWARYLGIEPEDMEGLVEAIDEALDGRELTREELAAEVSRRRRSRRLAEALTHSWGGLLKPASYRGSLCFAPSRGQRVRFTNPRSWLGVEGVADRSEEEALRDVLRRFVATNGPASTQEIARWWGGPSATRVEELIGSLGDEVAPVDVDGVRAWALAEHADAIASAEPARSVRLLPTFDQYVIGTTKHSHELMPGAFRDRVHRQAGWVSPVLLVDGMIEGVWSHAKKGKRASVAIEPFRKQPAWVRKGAEAEAELLAGYLDGELELTWEA
jgi:Winged helix DNA-binding domain